MSNSFGLLFSHKLYFKVSIIMIEYFLFGYHRKTQFLITHNISVISVPYILSKIQIKILLLIIQLLCQRVSANMMSN